MKKIFPLFLALCLCFSLCACNTEKQPLPAPQNLHMESKVLVWDEVEHASGYLVAFEDFEHETKFFHYDLSELVVPGTYEIDVMTIGGDGYFDSQWTKFSYTVTSSAEEPSAEDEPTSPAEYDEDGYEYHLLADGSGYEFAQGKAGLVENLVIPDTFKGLPVKRIADHAFPVHSLDLVNATTKSITFPAHLESIEATAFFKMARLEEIVIPDSVTVIEHAAFGQCMSLKHVKFPKNLKVLGAYCFDGCSLEEIELPDGLEEIGDWAFASTDLYGRPQTFTSVIIPDSVKRIGACAFRSVASLQEVTLPTENLEWMDYAVFGGTAWEEARSDAPIIIGDLLYEYNSDEHGETITIPAGVKKIAGQAFSFSILTSLPDPAEVILPDGVKLIGEDIFTNCENLKTVRLPADLTEIPEGTFNGCKSLSKLTIPKSVTTIENSAFRNCTSLSELTIPESVVSIGWSAFSGCENLSKISLPEGMQTLDDSAFSQCTSLKDIMIPASIKNLGKTVFYECTALEKVFYEGTKQQLGVLKAQNDYPTTLYDGTTYASVLFANATVYCYAETKPISGNYWHYVNGTPTIW